MKCFVGKESLVAESGQAARFRRELPANALWVREVFFLDCEPDMPAVRMACRTLLPGSTLLASGRFSILGGADVRVVLLAACAPASRFFCVV